MGSAGTPAPTPPDRHRTAAATRTQLLVHQRAALPVHLPGKLRADVRLHGRRRCLGVHQRAPAVDLGGVHGARSGSITLNRRQRRTLGPGGPGHVLHRPVPGRAAHLRLGLHADAERLRAHRQPVQSPSAATARSRATSSATTARTTAAMEAACRAACGAARTAATAPRTAPSSATTASTPPCTAAPARRAARAACGRRTAATASCPTASSATRAPQNGSGYGHCTAGCTLGPRCGDGIVQSLRRRAVRPRHRQRRQRR